MGSGSTGGGPVPRGAGGLKSASYQANILGFGPVPRGAGGLKYNDFLLMSVMQVVPSREGRVD